MRISDWSSDVCSSDLTSRISLPQPPSSFALFFAPRFAMEISVLDCFDDNEGLRPGMVVGQRQMDMRAVSRRGHLREPFGRSAGQRERDRKSAVSGKSVSVRVDLGGPRIIKKKN